MELHRNDYTEFEKFSTSEIPLGKGAEERELKGQRKFVGI